MSVLTYIPFTAKSNNTSLPSVVCLGNFDGVHIGHAKLLKETIDMCNLIGVENTRACVLCFSPFPADFFSSSPVQHIMALDDKIDIFRSNGIDGVYICDFEKIHEYSPEKFIEEILLNECNCIGAVCGFNYKFGKHAVGTPDDLKKHFDFFKKVSPITSDGQIVSSSLIKEYIKKGDIAAANVMLGRPYFIKHLVVHGKNLGTKLGFPTLNHVFEGNELVPSFGIYATVTDIDSKKYMSVTNIGVRPTVSYSDVITCETHVVDCADGSDFYGHYAKISFFKKLRDEKKFDSLDELSAAISSDVKNTKDFFENHNQNE